MNNKVTFETSVVSQEDITKYEIDVVQKKLNVIKTQNIRYKHTRKFRENLLSMLKKHDFETVQEVIDFVEKGNLLSEQSRQERKAEALRLHDQLNDLLKVQRDQFESKIESNNA